NGGALRSTASFTINSNRSITIGPSSGSGSGTFDIAGNTSLTYGGVVGNNGSGTGSLVKRSFGNLSLTASNAYTGPTLIQDGTLTLDFSGSASPLLNEVKTNSALVIGGQPQGLAQTNYARLYAIGKPGASNYQAFA